MSSDEQAAPDLPLGKYLASTDKKTRDKAVKSLAAFLSTPAQDALPRSEMAKLWKGIFYCYWMSDKPRVQQALSTELAEIVLSISSAKASLSFLRGFWEAIVREWSGIDRLRMDKYYMLVRKFVNAGFRLLLREQWEKEAVTEYKDILTCRGGPLCALDVRIPASLSYHLADIYLVELDKVLKPSDDADADTEESAPAPAPLSPLLYPFFDLAARTNSNVTYQRVHDEILDRLFLALKRQPVLSPEPPQRKRPRLENEPTFENIRSNSCLEDPKKEDKVDSVQLRKDLLRKMFDVANGPDTRESNRKKLHALWKAAMAEERIREVQQNSQD
ncbi:Nop52-domain-containing protein [Fomitiporia mediterranea MF3/22]|uniref:Nop52-domain-containing protein n=1 Tax=Fomitiporia mediterranea (strain MF3/22) TaxID=694068 RepID=UPI0004408C73|nr:Nop52-domain-containing protein [Fomitiporia mediterranea MF3/22]EJD04195.1 Nop52-domain-containing protein [Fomitiporia mediterranea MF3/22]